MLSFDSKRATITESETYAQGFLTYPLTADFSVVDPQRMMCTYRLAEGFYSTARICMACVGQYQCNTL